MGGRYIDESVQRRLYAESMGRCMNPDCQIELFYENGDIIERAHIVPYCETADNTFENLVLLCPNCHTNFDKNHVFTPDEVLRWKEIRKEEFERFFTKSFSAFDELKNAAVPLLLRNKSIYENYYLKNKRELWDKFEPEILSNNRKLKALFSANLGLFQRHKNKSYSNLDIIQSFIAHVEEFEATRSDGEKCREVLFPPEKNSMFGIEPVRDSILPFTESLELLIKNLKLKGKFENIFMGIERPYIQMIEDGKSIKVFLDDVPRLRQLYFDCNCFRGAKVRLDNLNFALKYINSRNVSYNFISDNNLKDVYPNKRMN